MCRACNTSTPGMQQRTLHVASRWHTVRHRLGRYRLPRMRSRTVAHTCNSRPIERAPAQACGAAPPRPPLRPEWAVERHSCCGDTGAGARHVLPRGDADGVLWEGACGRISRSALVAVHAEPQAVDRSVATVKGCAVEHCVSWRRQSARPAAKLAVLFAPHRTAPHRTVARYSGRNADLRR